MNKFAWHALGELQRGFRTILQQAANDRQIMKSAHRDCPPPKDTESNSRKAILAVGYRRQ